jgi:integrase
MLNKYTISIFLDTRRSKKNEKYPVKLRVFTPEPRKQKLYPTNFEFTEDEFENVWKTNKPKKKYHDDRLLLHDIEKEANDVAKALPYFTFKSFEDALFYKGPTGKNDVGYYYDKAIEQYKKNNQIGTASNYEYSKKSLLKFHKKEKLSFDRITIQWLKNYEKYLVDDLERSPTTVGIYLRPLRAVYNTALADNVVDEQDYPFGKKKYVIPSPKSVKKALNRDQLKLLFESEPPNPEQQKAKDFWFFSYANNGMNFKDIAHLKYKNLDAESIKFNRAKTKTTNKKQAPVTIFLNDFTREVLKKYGNPNKSPNSFIFTIIDVEDNPEKKHTKLKNFTRFVNQHIEKFAKSIGIDVGISTYWARHTFATNAIRNGASLEFVSEALSHSNLKTTIGYFAGFEDEEKKEFANTIMNF